MSAFNDIYTLHNIRSSNKNTNLKLFKLISKHIKLLINNELSSKNKFISNSNNIINDFNKQNGKLENSYEIWNDLSTEYSYNNQKENNDKFDARIPNPKYKPNKPEPIVNGNVKQDNESESESESDSSSESDSESDSDSDSDSNSSDTDSEDEDDDSDENNNKEEHILSNKEHERQFEIIKEGYEIKPVNSQIYEDQFLTYNQIKSNNYNKLHKLINSNIIFRKTSFVNYNINNLVNVLQICLLRNDFKNAYLAFSLIVRLPGVDIREIWPIGLEILKNLNELEFIDILNESLKEHESESASGSGSDSDSTLNANTNSSLLNNKKSLRKSTSPASSTTSNNSDTIRARRKRERIINSIPINNLKFLTLNKNKNLSYLKKLYSSNLTDISFNLIKDTIQDENRENLNKILKFLNWIDTFYSISYFSFSGIYPEQPIPDHLNPKFKLFKELQPVDKIQPENGNNTTNGESSMTQNNTIANGDSTTIPNESVDTDDVLANLKISRMSNNKSILWRSGTRNFVPMYIISLLWELIISGNTAQCMSLISKLTFNPPFDTDPSIKFCFATCKYIQLITILVEECFDPDYNNEDDEEEEQHSDIENGYDNTFNKDYHNFNPKSLNWMKIQDCNQLLTDCKQLYKKVNDSKFQFPYRKIKTELDKISNLLNKNNENSSNKKSNEFNKEQHRRSNKRKLSFNTSNLSSDDDSDNYIKSRSRHNSTSNSFSTKTILEEDDLKSDDSTKQDIDEDYETYNIFNSMSSNKNNKKAKLQNDYLSQINNNETMPSFRYDEEEYDDGFEKTRERNPDSEFEDD
ncbi:hypothetical protein BVG19_g3463 [[Candida] boidinii]|nr:hypothetical protein BVG19_g3463 [[Candida] boidinii]OWB52035.1 hypothetical protein B5S27_g3606 [[Candida] boidinii]